MYIQNRHMSEFSDTSQRLHINMCVYIYRDTHIGIDTCKNKTRTIHILYPKSTSVSISDVYVYRYMYTYSSICSSRNMDMRVCKWAGCQITCRDPGKRGIEASGKCSNTCEELSYEHPLEGDYTGAKHVAY